MRYWMQQEKIPLENVLVIVDDLALPVGALRLKGQGSDGGHNGLKSIIAHLSSEDFPRIKIGVGQKPSPDYDLVNWVLGRFSDGDIEKLGGQFDNIRCSVELIIQGKIDEAMNKYSK